jgi:hypothetical protein
MLIGELPVTYSHSVIPKTVQHKIPFSESDQIPEMLVHDEDKDGSEEEPAPSRSPLGPWGGPVKDVPNE